MQYFNSHLFFFLYILKIVVKTPDNKMKGFNDNLIAETFNYNCKIRAWVFEGMLLSSFQA